MTDLTEIAARVAAYLDGIAADDDGDGVLDTVRLNFSGGQWLDVHRLLASDLRALIVHTKESATVSTSKPAVAAATTVLPAELAQRDLADLPMAQTRGRHSLRRLTLGTPDGERVAIHFDLAGALLPEEIDDVLAELVAIRVAARREQARQTAADERAAEVETLARDLERDELFAQLLAAEEIGNAGAASVYLDALELQHTYAEEAAIELGHSAREARTAVA